MCRAVKMWDTSEYRIDRAAGALRHAKYKELPTVRSRRIKGIEADKRKQERSKDEAAKWLKPSRAVSRSISLCPCSSLPIHRGATKRIGLPEASFMKR